MSRCLIALTLLLLAACASSNSDRGFYVGAGGGVQRAEPSK